MTQPIKNVISEAKYIERKTRERTKCEVKKLLSGHWKYQRETVILNGTIIVL